MESRVHIDERATTFRIIAFASIGSLHRNALLKLSFPVHSHLGGVLFIFVTESVCDSASFHLIYVPSRRIFNGINENEKIRNKSLVHVIYSLFYTDIRV